MNANELADVLEELHEQDKSDGVGHLAMPEAATMLRQQQAEIETLKKQVISDDYVFVCKRCGDELGIKFEEQEK